MTKLYYPQNGIYPITNINFSDGLNNLSKAISYCDFIVPYGFRYSSQVRSLYRDIRNYYNELNNIKYSIQKVSKNYDELEEILTNSLKNLESIKIVERDRMII